MKREVENHSKPCQADMLVKQLNSFTYPYAFKYPVYKNPKNETEYPYLLNKPDLNDDQRHALTDLYDAYCMTPQYATGEGITEEDKIELILDYQDEYRTLFRREEERIIYTEVFRRLQYKTQIMVNSASDDQRTRLLHSMEVQKNARKIAIAMNANYELAETIAIAHDIGHAPFGHAGEKAIDKYLEDQWAGGFSHALQSVKVVDFLCSHRALKPKGLKGLGVSDLVLEGILKHDSDSFTQNIASAKYKLQYDCPALYKPVGVKDTSRYPENEISIGGIETQIVCWADKIAYMGHDWEEFVDVDLLEVMLSRVNSMVITLVGFCEGESCGSQSKKFDYVSSYEKEKLQELYLKLKELKEKFSADDYNCNKYSSEDPFAISIDNLVATCSEIIDSRNRKPAQFLLFTREQYCAFFAFFKVARCWMTITHRKPKKLGGKPDVIFMIYKYLSGTTSHRTVPALINRLVASSISDLTPNNQAHLSRDEIIESCNRKWIEVKEKNADCKFIKSKLRGCFAVHFDKECTEATEYINSFINDEFIKSTRVRYMTQKAEIIIQKLMDYYFENYEMLPIKYRNRVEFESNHKQNLSNVKKLLKEYYMDKANDENAESVLRERLQLLEQPSDKVVKEVIKLRIIADYVSGMTDRMAEMKYNEICSSGTQWSKAYSERGTFNL